MLASCGTDIKLHSCPTYELAHVYRPADSSGQIRNISWCKDGSWLVLVPNRGNAEIIRTKEDVRLLQTILGVAQPTASVFQRTTKRNVAMSTVSGSVLIYDIKTKSIKKRFVNSGSTVTMLDWNLKDTHLAIGNTDGQVLLYSNTTNQRTSILNIPESKSVSVVRFHSTQRNVLGTASDEGVVAVWDINNSQEKMTAKSHKAPVTDIVFSPRNTNFMVSVGLDRTFQCYDSSTRAIASCVLTEQPLSAIDMAQDGVTIAVASSRGTIYIYDLRKHETPIKAIAAHSGEIKTIFFQLCSLELTTDSVPIADEKPVEEHFQSSNGSVDSFANFLSNVNEFSSNANNANLEEIIEQDEKLKTSSNSAVGDSFFNGLENFNIKRTTGSFMGTKSEVSNLGLSDSVKKCLDKKKKHLEPQSSPYSSASCESSGKISDVPQVMISSSTPRQHNAGKISFIKAEELASSNISPIISSPILITTDQHNKIVKDVVKKMTEQFSDLRDTLSSFEMNLQLCLCKQFIAVEKHMDKLYYTSAPNSHLSRQAEQLQQENDFLRNKINELLRKNKS